MLERNPYLINKAFKSYLIATILATMSSTLGVVVDGIIVGNLIDHDALSAVNLASPLLQLFNAITILFNVGGATLMAIAIGKGKKEDINNIFSLSMSLNVIAGILIIFLGYFYLDQIVSMLCSDETLKPWVRDYVQVVLCSAPVYILLPGICVYIRTDSNPRLASVAIVTANILNLILDIVFIKVLGWGVMGSAVATTVGYVVGIAIAFSHFAKVNRLIHFIKPSFQKQITPMLAMGLSLTLASVLMMVRLLSVNHIILYALGASGMAIMSVCFNILMVCNMFVSGTSQTLQPIGGVLLGSEDYKGMSFLFRTTFRTIILCLGILTVLLFAFPAVAAMMFGIKETALLLQAESAIRLFVLSLPLFGVNYLLLVVYQIEGRSKLSVMVSCTQALMVIPIMILTLFLHQTDALWLSFAIGESLVFLLVWITTQHIRRKEKALLPISLIKSIQEDERIIDFSLLGKPEEMKEMIDSVEKFLFKHELDARLRNAILLCNEELVQNIIQHAFKNDKKHFIDIKISILPEKSIICIKDDGSPFNPVEKDKNSGLGLLLVKGLCSDISYSYTMNQNIVTVIVT